MAATNGRKVIALARHIVDSGGLSPAELIIVMPMDGDEHRHVVLEGNRRVMALKVLEHPDLVDGSIDTAGMKELRRLSKVYLENPIEEVRCWVANNRKDAEQWLELRHTGENDGAGLVRWSNSDIERFRARHKRVPAHLQALDWLQERGDLSEEDLRRLHTTSFARFIEDKAARSQLGLDVQDGVLLRLGKEDAVAKALVRVAKDLIQKRIKTSDIYRKEDRKTYLDGLPKGLRVQPARRPGKGVPVENNGKSEEEAPVPKRPKPLKGKTVRDKLVPRDCTLSVTDRRLQAIEYELRKLSLEEFTNAVSVLFRVFVELSVDHFLETHLPGKSGDNDTLARKLQLVVDDLIARKKLTKSQATPVRRFMAKDSFLAPSVTLLHKYVHCQHIFPTPSDLRGSWDGLQPFLMAIWSP